MANALLAPAGGPFASPWKKSVTAISPAAEYEEVSLLDTLFVLAATLLLAVQILNLATFNHQPDKVRTAIDAMSLLGYGVLYLGSLAYASRATVLHLFGLILFLGAGIVGIMRNPVHASISDYVKDATGPVLLSILTMRWKPAPGPLQLRLLWIVVIPAILLGAYLAFTGTPYMNGESKRLAVFAGGDTGLHPSAYATSCFLFLLFVIYRARVGWALVSLAALGVAAATIIGYEVRTVWLMIMVFVAVLSVNWTFRHSPWLVIGGAGAALIAAAAFLLALNASHFDLAHFSSGRTVIYGERLHLIAGRSLPDFLFGTGSGTDQMRGVDAWRWEAKDSHNDFMTMLIELGVVGLIGFGVIVLAGVWAMPGRYKAWVLMMIASAAVSNGILLRPSLGPPMVLIAYIAVALRDRAQRAEWRAEEEEEEAELSADRERLADAAE